MCEFGPLDKQENNYHQCQLCYGVTVKEQRGRIYVQRTEIELYICIRLYKTVLTSAHRTDHYYLSGNKHEFWSINTDRNFNTCQL